MKTNLTKTLKILAAVGILFALVGAIGLFFLNGGWTTTQTRAEFEEVVVTTNRDTRGSAFYRGRKDGYDYFKAQWNVGSKNLRIPVSESPVAEPFDYTSDREKWRGASFMNLEGAELRQALEQRFNRDTAS